MCVQCFPIFIWDQSLFQFAAPFLSCLVVDVSFFALSFISCCSAFYSHCAYYVIAKNAYIYDRPFTVMTVRVAYVDQKNHRKNHTLNIRTNDCNGFGFSSSSRAFQHKIVLLFQHFRFCIVSISFLSSRSLYFCRILSYSFNFSCFFIFPDLSQPMTIPLENCVFKSQFLSFR